MRGIKIKKINPTKVDERGETFELFKSLPGKQVTLYRRRKGAAFAGHWHKGLDPSKNPELFFLIAGEIELFAVNGLTNDGQREIVIANSLITIEKNIYHEMKALTEVIFMEYRATVFNPARTDCFSKEGYKEFLASRGKIPLPF